MQICHTKKYNIFFLFLFYIYIYSRYVNEIINKGNIFSFFNKVQQTSRFTSSCNIYSKSILEEAQKSGSRKRWKDPSLPPLFLIIIIVYVHFTVIFTYKKISVFILCPVFFVHFTTFFFYSSGWRLYRYTYNTLIVYAVETE